MANTGDEHGVTHVGANDADLQPGQEVGEYIVRDKLGEGGFGSVFRAEHPVIGKQVAIKVLARQFSADPEMVSRFVAEARSVNQIRHRNIIDIFSFGQLDDGRHYYIMELLSGRPLDEYLDARGRLEVEEAIHILRGVARALDAAHAKGIAHRDLKPENIFLLEEEGQPPFPKLLDFGIAKLLTKDEERKHKTRTGAPIGTPLYMSPEQCRGKDVDHRTDIYAFGIMAYRMLVGQVPFDGDNFMDILVAQMNTPPKRPSEVNPSLPAALDAPMLWMMAKEADKRPPTLGAGLEALEDAARGAGFDIARTASSDVFRSGLSGLSGARSAKSSAQFAPTVTPTELAMAATHASGMPTPLPESMTGMPEVAARSKLPLIIGAVIAAAAVVAVVVMMGGGDKSEREVAKAPTASTPAAPVPAAAPPDAAPPPIDAATLSRYVEVSFQGAPEGTEIYGPGGVLFGVVPTVQLERSNAPVQLTLKADGYQPMSMTITPSDDHSEEVSLKEKRGKSSKPRVRQGGTGRSNRNTIESPF